MLNVHTQVKVCIWFIINDKFIVNIIWRYVNILFNNISYTYHIDNANIESLILENVFLISN